MAAYNVLKKKEKKIKSGEHVFLPPLPHPPVARALYSQMYEYVIEKITWDKKKKTLYRIKICVIVNSDWHLMINYCYPFICSRLNIFIDQL